MKRYSIVGAPPGLVSSVGGANLSVKPLIGVVFAHMTNEQVAVLIVKNPGVTIRLVDTVTPKVTIPTPVPASAADSLTPESLINETKLNTFRNSFTPPLLGTDVNIAVVDTGVRTTHKSLDGKVVYSENFTSSPTTGDVFNHGTGVAHIVHVTAPDSNILNMKAIADDGTATEEQITSAIERCIEMKVANHQYAPHIINLSLGSLDAGDPNDIMRVACRTAIEQYNIWIAAAAGNDGPAPGTITCPACEQYVMAVGSASFPDNTLDDFSSRGPTKEGLVKPDVLMVGSDVLMASSTGDDAEVAKSGTSFSTPFMCGLAAWFKQGSKVQVLRDEFKMAVQPRFYVYASYDPTMVQILDEYIPGVCLRPGDTVRPNYVPSKDNNNGYGTFCAPMAISFLSEVESKATAQAVGGIINSIMQPLMTIMVMGMMANFMRSMFKPEVKSKKGVKYT